MRVASLAMGVTACSVLTNLADLESSDAAPDAFQGGPADATTEGIPDTSTVDGIADGTTSTSFCAQVDAAFCDDFERDGAFVPPWTGVFTSGGGTVTRAEIDSGCVSIIVGAGDAAPAANLNKILGSASKIHYAFDMQVAQYSTSPGASVNTSQVYLPLADGGSILAGYVYLAFSAATARLVEQHHYADGGFSAQTSVSFGPPSAGPWHHVDLTIDIGGLTANVTVDQQPSVGITLPAIYEPGQPTAYAGVTFETVSSDHFAMYLDNTVVWLE